MIALESIDSGLSLLKEFDFYLKYRVKKQLLKKIYRLR